MIYGWGVTEPTHSNMKAQKYWLVRNSFGSEWGLNGDFMVGRGSNDLGIEQEVVSPEVELIQ